MWAAYQQSKDLQHQLQQAQQQVAELTRELAQTTSALEELQHQHTTTLEELATLKRLLYGRSRERHEDQDQPQQLDAPPSEKEVCAGQEDPSPAAHPKRRGQRRPLDLSHLPHHRHVVDLDEDQKICSCCQRLKDRIGEDVSQSLEYVPARLEVHEYVRGKYACRYCKDGVCSPPPLSRVLARSIAGVGLLAQIVVGKYGDHLPLYRQEDVWLRHGLHLPRSTLCDWIAGVADRLLPLYQRQRQGVLQSDMLWTDDTPVTVLRGAPLGSRKGRFWTYIGDEQHPWSVYDFTMSRSRDGPQQFLRGFRGYLHADAYAGYDAIFLGCDHEVVEVACWAHARRKFFDIQEHAPREARQMLHWIGQLYDIEDRARLLSVDARARLRRLEANPVLDQMHKYLDQLALTVLPKSTLAKAVGYVRNQWQALRCYTCDGRLTIDNNTSERTLRPQALGRKNWLFLGSQQAGQRAAVLYTILAGAKRHSLEPWSYLRDVLEKLSSGEPDVEGLLPERWAKQHPEAILTYRLEESRQKAERQRQRRQRRRVAGNGSQQ